MHLGTANYRIIDNIKKSDIQLLCLVVMLFYVSTSFVGADFITVGVDPIILIVPAIFFSVSFPIKEHNIKLFIITVLYLFFILILLNLQHILTGYSEGATEYFLALMIAFPFGFLTDAKTKRRGLIAAAFFFISISVLLCIGSYLLFLDKLPHFLMDNFEISEDNRLHANMWPTTSAFLFYIGLFFSLCLFLISRKKVVKATMLFLIAFQLYPIIRTLTRSVLLFVIVLLLWFAVLLLYQLPTVKQYLRLKQVKIAIIIAGFIAIIVLIGFLFAFSLYRYGSISDIFTLNQRTDIYKAAILTSLTNPKEFFVGFGNDYFIFTNFLKLGRYNSHAHNSWLQALLKQGIVGFIISLAITFDAIKATLLALKGAGKHKNSSLIALTCVFISTYFMYAFIEPIIFTSAIPETNVLFFFLLGYIVDWQRK